MLHSKIFDKINSSLNNIAANALYDFYYNSNCKEVYLEEFTDNKLGFSDYKKIYLNPLVLDLPIHYFLYVFLHEVAHQYQYKKYGKKYVLDLYLNKDTYQKFWEVEVVADRLSIRKTTEILNKNKKDNIIKLTSTYNTESKKEYIKKYLEEIQNEINKKQLKTIEEINNYLIQKNKKYVHM